MSLFDHKKSGGGKSAGKKPSRSLSPMLLQAHRLFSWRQYLPAADLYERLAEGALLREPTRSPHLFLQAGKARLAGGQVELGMEQIRRGLGLLNSQQRIVELQRAGWRVIQNLENNGMDQQAEEVRQWMADLKTTESGLDWSIPPVSVTPPSRLPHACPACGGVVDPAEVEWVDQITVECIFCGRLVRGEEA